MIHHFDLYKHIKNKSDCQHNKKTPLQPFFLIIRKTKQKNVNGSGQNLKLSKERKK